MVVIFDVVFILFQCFVASSILRHIASRINKQIIISFGATYTGSAVPYRLVLGAWNCGVGLFADGLVYSF